MGNKTSLPKNFRAITWDEAMNFKESYTFPSFTSVFTFATHTATLKYGSERTNPNVPVIGSDENYVITSGNEIERGRNISPAEVYSGSHVAVVGADVITRLFGEGVDPVDRIIGIGAGKYRVIGVLKAKGSSLGFNPDNICILPSQT